MAMTINGTSGVTFNDGTSMATGQQACKAWVNFNGTGTVAIRAAYNVSSITDNGTGEYTVNFTAAMVDANYAASITVDSGGNAFMCRTLDSVTARTTTTLRMNVLTNIAASTDSSVISVSVFR